MGVQVSATADNPKTGLTLGELEAFIVRARQLGFDDMDRVKVVVRLGGWVKQVTLHPGIDRD
jgi:hypothetical protein